MDNDGEHVDLGLLHNYRVLNDLFILVDHPRTIHNAQTLMFSIIFFMKY